MRLLSLLLGVAVAIGTSWSAKAALYNFTIDSVDYDVVGQITTSGDQITAITGQVTGLLNAPISGLEGQPNIFFTSDNLLSPTSQPFVSNAGLLFGAGGFFYNIYSIEIGPDFQYYIATNQFGGDYFFDPLYNPGSLILSSSISAIPEPSTWLMMILGFLAISTFGFAKRTSWRGGPRAASS